MSLIMDVINKINDQSMQIKPAVVVPEKLKPETRQTLVTPFTPSGKREQTKKWRKPSRLTFIGFAVACFSLAVIWFATQLITSYWTFETNFVPAQMEAVDADKASANAAARELGMGQNSGVNSGWESADVLEGILYDKENPICLIKGEVFKQGDTWNGNKIEMIFQDHVLLTSKSGRAFKLMQPR